MRAFPDPIGRNVPNPDTRVRIPETGVVFAPSHRWRKLAENGWIRVVDDEPRRVQSQPVAPVSQPAEVEHQPAPRRRGRR